MAARAAAGPGFWAGWLSGLGRQGLLEELPAEDDRAGAAGSAGRAQVRPGPEREGDRDLRAGRVPVARRRLRRRARAGVALPGLRSGPGGVPAGSAFSQARKLLGEQVMKRIFELDAARPGAELAITALRKGLEVTAPDGTTMELARNDALACEPGSSPASGRPLLGVAAHVRTATRRWTAAEADSYHDGENDLAGRLEWPFRPGMLNLADRGFFSMDRFVRFPAAGADLAWRVNNSAKSIPCKTPEILPDGPELVILHESDGMRARRRRESRDHAAPRLPEAIARLVTFTVTARTRSGRPETTRIRVLTTQPDHRGHPARDIALLHAERWHTENAFLHLKKTVRGSRRPLRGQPR